MIPCQTCAALISGVYICVLSAAPQQPVAAAQMGEVFASEIQTLDASPVFLSDESLAVLARFGEPRKGDSGIVVMRWASEKLQAIAKASKMNEGDEIYAVARNRVLTSAHSHKYLYSSDLAQKQEIPFRVISRAFPRSEVVGEDGLETWRVFRFSSPLTLIREGPGELLSLSDDVFVFHLGNEIKTQAADGRLLGSIPVSPDSKGSYIAEIAGKGRLYLGSAGEQRIVDFSGKQFLRVHPPDGWGFRHGWSADGRRMMFDHYTRTVSGWDRAVEWVVDRLSFGVPEESNGETVRVVDTTTGGVCFDLETPGKLLGKVGGYHADLSPSGRWVAVATLKELSIYRLPDDCGGK